MTMLEKAKLKGAKDMMAAKRKKRCGRVNWQGYLMVSMGAVFLLIFAYIPMVGILMAFKDMDYALNVMKALQTKPWVGLQNFQKFLADPQFLSVIWNTVALNILSLFVVFPVPIIYALLLNEIRNKRFLRVVQTVTVFPNFVSWAIFGGLLISFLSSDGGIINELFVALGILDKPVNFMTKPGYFWQIIQISSLIKGTGWSSIIYLAAISNVDPQLYESAILDGGNRFQMAWYITLPCIAGTIIVMFLMRISNILGNSFDQFYILQNSLNLEKSEVLSTFMYKVGIGKRRYSYSTAVGLFSSGIGFVLLSMGHVISKKLTGRGLY